VPAVLRILLPTIPSFVVDGFEPLGGYEAVRSVVLRASEAAAKDGYLGPVEDPESDHRGREAREALIAVCAELEFRDDAGRLVPVDVIVFAETQSAGETFFTLGGEVEDATATVYARLPPRRGGDSAHGSPAV
jgi:hypothetical protein